MKKHGKGDFDKAAYSNQHEMGLAHLRKYMVNFVGTTIVSRATSFTICEDTWFTTFRPIILKRKRSCSEKLLV